jgi:hypothetical protein
MRLSYIRSVGKGPSAVGLEGGIVSAEDIRVDDLLEAFFVTKFQKRLPFEDARNGLGYPLRRLGVVGLSQRDIEELTELGQAVFQDGDVHGIAKRIWERQGASPLAVAIANIVNSVEKHDKREAVVGAIFGAYTRLESGRMREAVLGAIGGALAATTYSDLQDFLGESEMSWQRWAKMGDVE